jgi:hypothetical protein
MPSLCERIAEKGASEYPDDAGPFFSWESAMLFSAWQCFGQVGRMEFALSLLPSFHGLVLAVDLWERRGSQALGYMGPAFV